MTADQRDLLQNWVRFAREHAAISRLPVGPMVDAVEAALAEIDRLSQPCPHSWHTAETPDGGASVACDLCGKVMGEEDVEEGD